MADIAALAGLFDASAAGSVLDNLSGPRSPGAAPPGTGRFYYEETLFHIECRELALAEARARGDQATILRLEDELRAFHHTERKLADLVGQDYARGVREKLEQEREAIAQMWQGEPVDSLAVRDDLGLGDSLQVSRYLRQARERARRVTLLCPPELERLYHLSGVADRVLVRGGTYPKAAAYSTSTALQGVFTGRPVVIPPPLPLTPPPLTPRLRALLRQGAGTLRVGLVWAAGSRKADGALRSLDLAMLAPLGAVRGATFFGLQKGPRAEQADAPPPGLALVNVGPDLTDLADTAAVLTRLDLVITPDTSVMHLAGSLGRPTWVLLQTPAVFYWGQTGDTTPWYPSVRFFRQERPREWDPVVRRVAAELRRVVAKRGQTGG